MSCGSAPCKVAKCIMQRTMHAIGILGSQNLLPPGLANSRRRATDFRRNVQRPAEMLARMAKPDTQAIMADDFVVERADVFQLIGQRRRGFRDSSFQAASDLARQPWLALRAAP